MGNEQTNEGFFPALRNLLRQGDRRASHPARLDGTRGSFPITIGLALAAAIAAASCGRATARSVPNEPWWSARNLGGDPTHGNVLRRALMHRYR